MADTSAPLTKVDSAVADGHAEVKKGPAHRRTSSSAIAEGDAEVQPGPARRRTSSSASAAFNINELEKQDVELKIAPETQHLNWKMNSSPTTIEDKEVLKKLLLEPPVKSILLHFPLGLEVTARNLKGVTIKDAIDAIYKQFKKKADDELENPYLAGFEWDKEECYTRFIVHMKKEGAPAPSKKSKKKNAIEEE